MAKFKEQYTFTFTRTCLGCDYFGDLPCFDCVQFDSEAAHNNFLPKDREIRELWTGDKRTWEEENKEWEDMAWGTVHKGRVSYRLLERIYAP